MGTRTRGQHAALNRQQRVCAGRKTDSAFEIYGTKSSVAWVEEWKQERRPKSGQVTRHRQPDLRKDPSMLKPAARAYAGPSPAATCEGYDETFKQVFRRFYASIGTHRAAQPKSASSSGTD